MVPVVSTLPKFNTTTLAEGAGDQIHVVLHQHHGHTLLGNASDQVRQRQLLGWRGAGGRLVDQEQQRLGGQATRDLQPAAFPVGQFRRLIFCATFAKPTRVSSASRFRPGPPARARRGSAIGQSGKPKMLQHGQTLRQPDILKRGGVMPRSTSRDNRRQPCFVTVDPDMSGIDRHHAGQATNQGRFAGSVRADDRGLTRSVRAVSETLSSACRPPEAFGNAINLDPHEPPPRRYFAVS